MQKRGSLVGAVALILFAGCLSEARGAGAFLFANADRRNRITHPIGYTGATNQHLVIRLGIIPGSSHQQAMVIPTENAIRTWNALEGKLPNIYLGSSSGIPSNHFDFESVLLHEMGHALGMAHPNLGTESGLDFEFQDFTRSTPGSNGQFDLNAGADGIPGSRLDIRGDDLPLLWFNKATNNPFLNPAVVDVTTFSQSTSDLPAGDSYAANGGLDISPMYGFPSSEVVLQQGTRVREAQRDLTPGCVAAIRLAMAGFDRTQGTSDDYTFEIQYVGVTLEADIIIGFDDSRTGFAVSSLNATSPRADHYVLTRAQVYFNTTWNWFFNQEPNVSIPDSAQDQWSIF